MSQAIAVDDDSAQGHALYTSWLQRALTGEASAVVREIEEHQRFDSVPADVQGLWNHAKLVALFVGHRHDDAVDTADEICAAGSLNDDPALTALGLAARARLLTRSGAPLLALDAYGQAESLLQRHRRSLHSSPSWPGAVAEIFACAMELGPRMRAEQLLELSRVFTDDELLPVQRLSIAINTAEITLWEALSAVRHSPYHLDEVVLERAMQSAQEAHSLASKLGLDVAQASPELWNGVWHAWCGDPLVAAELLEPFLHGDLGAQLDTMRYSAAAALMRALRRSGDVERLHRLCRVEAATVTWTGERGSPAVVAYLWELTAATHPDIEDSASPLGHLGQLWEARDADRERFAHNLLELRLANLQAESERRELDDLARRDPLTALLNRRGLDPLMRAFARLPQGEVAALVVIDVDRLKNVNDTSGHAAGDTMLQAVAAALRDECRRDDAVGRIGGDEFVVLVRLGPDRDLPESMGERIRACITEATGGALSASVGVATRDGLVDSRAWAVAADEAMYAAKRSGGDRISVVSAMPGVC
ncbi:MAG: diguanylate cyclase [Nocardioidaceae bacterium]